MIVFTFTSQYLLLPVIGSSFYIMLFIFNVAYSIVTVIGAILGLLIVAIQREY